jgi:hypothetical protein
MNLSEPDPFESGLKQRAIQAAESRVPVDDTWAMENTIEAAHSVYMEEINRLREQLPKTRMPRAHCGCCGRLDVAVKPDGTFLSHGCEGTHKTPEETMAIGLVLSSREMVCPRCNQVVSRMYDGRPRKHRTQSGERCTYQLPDRVESGYKAGPRRRSCPMCGARVVFRKDGSPRVHAGCLAGRKTEPSISHPIEARLAELRANQAPNALS